MDEARLKENGWSLVTGPGPGKMLSLSTQIPHWGTMSWAEQTYHQARYGFDPQGTLFLHDHILQGRHDARQAALEATAHEHQGRRYAIPGGTIPGSDERLRKLLKDHGERDLMRARENTVLWRGRDGTILMTCPEGWGVPLHVEDGGAYCEFGERDELHCCWEGYGEQPGWSAVVPEEPDTPEGLDHRWELESEREMWGVRQRFYRDPDRIMEPAAIVTDDGQNTLRWDRKHTRKTLTETSHPRAGGDWTLFITSRGIPRMVAVTARRGGGTERVGNVRNFDLAYAAAHEYVQSTFNRSREEK